MLGVGRSISAVGELRVAIGVALSLARLAIGLQTELLLMQQLTDQRAANTMAFGDQDPRQLRQAFAGPAQRRHRIAARVRFDQCQQIGNQRGILRHSLLATAAGATDPSRSSGSAAANSFKPRPIVLAAIPVARTTAAIPPYPDVLASVAAKIRLARSSRCWDRAA